MPHKIVPIIEHIGTGHNNERELYMLDLASPDLLPRVFNTAGKYSTILVIWDATAVAADSIRRFARHVMDAGGIYFCVWGPDCERVHDLIDEEWVGDGFKPATDPMLMTTWHDKDSLDDAIWYALYNAMPMDESSADCRSVIAICVGCPQWAAEVRVAFADTQQFSDRLLGRDE